MANMEVIGMEQEQEIECDCGWTCRGTEEVLLAAAREHGREVHDMELTREQILAIARPVED
jgi:predicted small metal-binding protein